MVRLTDVAVEVGPTASTITFVWRGDLAGRKEVLWSMFVTDETGNTRQLGYKVVDEVPSAQFVFDHGAACQSGVAFDAARRDDSLTVRFPVSALAGVDFGSARQIRAVLSVDGQDLDERKITATDHRAG